MPNHKLPVIYAVVGSDGYPLDLARSQARAEELAKTRHSFDPRVVAYPPPPESPPREYWRLLEPKTGDNPGEVIRAGDEHTYHAPPITWSPVPALWIGKTFNAAIVRRRVAPPPTCATCEHRRAALPDIESTPGGQPIDPVVTCDHEDGPCSIPQDGSGYCHLHPQAQEVTR